MMQINISDHVTDNYGVPSFQKYKIDQFGRLTSSVLANGRYHDEEPIFTIENLSEKTINITESNPQDIRILTDHLTPIIINHINCSDLIVKIQKPVILQNCSCENISIEAFGLVKIQNVQCKTLCILSKDTEIDNIQCWKLTIKIPAYHELVFLTHNYEPKINKIQSSNSVIDTFTIKNFDVIVRNPIVSIKTNDMSINNLSFDLKASQIIIDIPEEIKNHRLKLDAFLIKMNTAFKRNYGILTVKDYIKMAFKSEEIKHILRCKNEYEDI